MNNNCLKTSLINKILPCLFNTNVETTMHNKNVFQNTLGQIITFIACDVHAKTWPSHLNYHIYHFKIMVKKKMLVELCARNYETLDGLVNGVNEIFEDFIEIISKSLV
jgi:hypothetical protein